MNLERILKENFTAAAYENFRKSISRKKFFDMKNKKLNEDNFKMLAEYFTAGDVLAFLKIFYEKKEPPKNKVNV